MTTARVEFVAGLALFAAGVALVYAPAALMLVGLVLVADAVARRREENKT